MKTIRQIDVARKIIYQKYKRTKESFGEVKELAYDEYDGYEIITMQVFNKGFETYKTFGRCGLEVLEKYTNKIDALAGHLKWCMEGDLC